MDDFKFEQVLNSADDGPVQKSDSETPVRKLATTNVYTARNVYYSKTTTTTTTYTPPQYAKVYKPKTTRTVYIPPPAPASNTRSGYYQPSSTTVIVNNKYTPPKSENGEQCDQNYACKSSCCKTNI